MKLRAPIYNRALLALKTLMCVAAIHTFADRAAAQPAHGIAMHGEPHHEAGFPHFDYVNPDAPKGGTATFAELGSFDSLNPLIVMGEPVEGMREFVYESLMARGHGEPFSLYGLLAETVETPDDRSWAAFTLRPEARFSDGEPVTVDDVISSHALLRDKGRPNHRTYYAKVAKVEKTGPRTVRFTFDGSGDREMPLIMGLMPVLPRHHVTQETFDRTTLKPPVGSGPYHVARVEPGKRIVYERDPDYWGRDLAVNRGRFNFDAIRYEYFRDSATMFEAFKKGLYDLRAESDPVRWATGYDFPAYHEGRIVKEAFETGVPAGMSGLVFNTRGPLFADRRVREALTLLFDFEWLNANLYHGLYTRTQSYFARSELSSHGRPADARERGLLESYTEAVKPAILDGSYALPETDGTGRNRQNLRKALALLKEAGYVLKDGRLVDEETGAPFTFEMLAATRGQERLMLSYARTLERAGIEASLRQVDSAQYQRRRQVFDFDMIQAYWPASLSPGNEQNFRWSSESARMEGSFNYPGVASPAVDAMIVALLSARDRPAFVSAVRALDRVLLSGHYVVPLFHLPRQWVARWKKLRHPAGTSLYGYRVQTWWIAPSGQ